MSKCDKDGVPVPGGQLCAKTPCASGTVASKPCCGGTNAAGGCGASAGCGDGDASTTSPLAYFDRMIDHCYDYACAAQAAGKPIVGIMCEFTPRELILAAGAVPVCLCGGSAETIPAAEADLPANLCPLIKSTYGYHVLKQNPFLEMAQLIVAETTCDGKKKMYELMSRSRPMYVLELPQKADDADARVHWLAELRKFKSHLERHFNVEITDRALRDAIAAMNVERSLRRQLAGLMAADNPPLTGSQLLQLKSSISAVPADMEQYRRALDVLSAKSHASPARPSTHPQAHSPVRVLMTGVPVVHGAQRVVDIIESVGGLIVCMENCTGLKPILEDVDASAGDPLEAIADKYFHLPCSVMTPNSRRLESLRQLANQYRPACVIELVWQACLTYDVEAAAVKQFVQQELKLPYLKISTDYSPADSARIAVRIEALMETVRIRGGGPAGQGSTGAQ